MTKGLERFLNECDDLIAQVQEAKDRATLTGEQPTMTLDDIVRLIGLMASVSVDAQTMAEALGRVYRQLGGPTR